MIRRHIHDEHVADAPPGPQPRLARDHGREQFVRVQTPLHQQLRLALPHQLHGFRGRGLAVRRVDDAGLPEGEAGLRGDLRDLLRRADENGRDQALLGGFERAGERRLFAGMRDRRGHRLKAAAALQQAFVLFLLPVSRLWMHDVMPRLPEPSARAAGPVSFKRSVRTIAAADSMEERHERGLVVHERQLARAAAGGHQQRREHGREQRAEREVDEVDDTRRRAAQLRRIGFLDHRVRQHRRARADARGQAEHVGRQHVGGTEQRPGEAREQEDTAAENDRLAPAEAIGEEAEQRTADDPSHRHHRRSQHRRAVVEAARVLQKPDAPDHVEDRRRDEQQAGDHAAENRLRIAKDHAHAARGARAASPAIDRATAAAAAGRRAAR